MFWPGTTS